MDLCGSQIRSCCPPRPISPCDVLAYPASPSSALSPHLASPFFCLVQAPVLAPCPTLFHLPTLMHRDWSRALLAAVALLVSPLAVSGIVTSDPQSQILFLRSEKPVSGLALDLPLPAPSRDGLLPTLICCSCSNLRSLAAHTPLERTMSKERRIKYHRPVQERDSGCRSCLEHLTSTLLRR